MDYPPEAGSRFRLFAPLAIVSWISQAVTLTPGDVVEVEIEGIGVLRHPVKAE